MKYYSRPRYRRSDPFMRRIKRLLIVFSMIALLMAGGILHLEYFAPSPQETSEPEDMFEPAPEPPGIADVVLPEDSAFTHTGIVAAGTNASLLLQDWLPASDIHSLVSACYNVYSLQQLRAGQQYTVFGEGGTLSRFEYEIDDDRKLVVCREAEAFVASLEQIDYEIELHRVSGTITSSLFATVADAGEAPSLAVRLAEIFAWEINFIREVQEGDSFALVVEKKFRDGEFKGYGKILGARFINDGKQFEAFRFADASGFASYFTAEGESLKRAFLKAPLSFTRISSQYTNRRFHPVLQTWKAHPAIDYAAPTGTPVKAIGNGHVTFAGSGKGAGNYIALKHGHGYESMYLHLSGFAKGVKKGAKVSQGQTIGFVGSTGYSTGPHLDFRMKKNGEFVNPTTVLSPRADRVGKKDLPAFNAQWKIYKEYLDGLRNVEEYVPDKEGSV